MRWITYTGPDAGSDRLASERSPDRCLHRLPNRKRPGRKTGPFFVVNAGWGRCCDKTPHLLASGFDAGIQAESFHPDCIIVDFSIGRTEALQICQNLRRNNDFSETILIALLPDDGSSMSFDRSSINETFKKPFDAALLAERLRTLIGAKKELV